MESPQQLREAVKKSLEALCIQPPAETPAQVAEGLFKLTGCGPDLQEAYPRKGLKTTFDVANYVRHDALAMYSEIKLSLGLLRDDMRELSMPEHKEVQAIIGIIDQAVHKTNKLAWRVLQDY